MALGNKAQSDVAETNTNHTVSHTPDAAGDPRAAVVFVMDVSSTDTITGVTYGGTAMTEMPGSPNIKTTGENAQITAWFLGASIPTGTQNIVASHSASSTRLVSVYTYTADADTEIVDSDATINSDSQANPSVTLSLTGRSCACLIGFGSGQDDITGISPLTNWTADREVDAGIETGGTYSYDIIGTSDVTAGWTQTADDATAFAVAIGEIVSGISIPVVINNLRNQGLL